MDAALLLEEDVDEHIEELIKACSAAGYTITAKLGKGSYGNVYRAVKVKDDSYVAIKAIRDNDECMLAVKSEKTKAFLERELLVFRCAQHDCVIKYGEIFSSRLFKACVVMEMASQGALSFWIRHYDICDLYQAIVFKQITEAIVYLHGISICHRDVKAENILMFSNLRAKLSDFGFSRAYDPRDLLSSLVGTPKVWAPEQIQELHYNPRMADAWSLGILLYEMVHSDVPFNIQRDGAKAVITKQLNGEYLLKDTAAPQALELIKSILRKVEDRPDPEEILKATWLSRTLKRPENIIILPAQFKSDNVGMKYKVLPPTACHHDCE